MTNNKLASFVVVKDVSDNSINSLSCRRDCKMKSKKISSLSFSLMILLSVISFGYILGSEMEEIRAEGFTENTYKIEGTNEQVIEHLFEDGSKRLFYESSGDWKYFDSDGKLIDFGFEGDVTEFRLNSYSLSNSQISEQRVEVEAPLLPVPTGENPLVNPDAPIWDTQQNKWISTGTRSSDEWTKSLNEGNIKPGGVSEAPTASSGTGGAGDTVTLQNTPFGALTAMYGFGYLVQSVIWAGAAYGIVSTLGGIFSATGDSDQAQVEAIGAALAVGIIAGRGVVGGLFAEGGLLQADKTKYVPDWLGSGGTQFVVGAATAWLTYNALYEKEQSKEIEVSFSCLPWQAPRGGADCELCNDGLLPCSEYRCKALGQSCDIINKGTQFEQCVNKNPRDVAPPIIKPSEDALSDGLYYDDVKEMPPGAGFKIKSRETTTGCIPPFTPFEWGIETNEPAQCKIDVEPKGNYSKMASYFGGDNLFAYNHTEYLSLPSTVDFKNSSISLENGRELNMFVRCVDASGNENEADYNIKVCVDPSPDTTPPKILGSSILPGSCVAANSDNTTIDFYVNEPAQCRWSFTDERFELMDYNMSCASNINEINALQVYTCNTLLTGIARDGTNFYVRCKDQPIGVNESKRNTNVESYQFNLRGSNPLKMKNLQPNETIFGSVRPTPVELYAETLFGCENNKATCFYSTTGAENSFIQFFDTNNEDGISTQRLDLYDGTHNYFIKCVDSGGNVASNATSFKLEIDPNAPLIARVYEEDDYLKIVTPKDSECVYTNQNCDFLFDEGTPMPYQNSTTHVTQWFSDKTYYIKCRDAFRTEPTDCSIIVRPTDNFLN